jgi:hypothetical protein
MIVNVTLVEAFKLLFTGGTSLALKCAVFINCRQSLFEMLSRRLEQ